MTSKIQYKIAFLFLFVGLQAVWSQKKDENIGTEVVNVVKSYTPTISDAFKVKEAPSLEDEDNTKREVITYNTFPFPVASTFSPSKGKAAGVERTERENLFNNYLTLGLGNYGAVNSELFVTENISREEYFGLMLRHLSSQGGINEVELENKFYTTSLDLTYGKQHSNSTWNANMGYKNQIYNWYGLPVDFGTALLPTDRTILINGIDPLLLFHDFYISGKINVDHSVFNEASFKYNRFWDARGSAENRFYAKPSFSFDVADEIIKTNFSVDYLGGAFKKDYNSAAGIQYGYTNFGVHPSIVINENDWSVNFGAALFYSVDTANKANKFYVYPKLKASFKVVGDLMILYAGAEGSLSQNSYADFANDNPFVSPTLNIKPTDQKYDVFAGLRGKFANNISYNVRGAYRSEKDKALFKSQNYSANAANEDYAFGNSFGVVYDNMKTINIYGELKADFSKNLSFGINGTFNSYKNDIEAEAWNLPALKLGASLDINITEKWSTGTNLFFVGDRKDLQLNNDIVTLVPIAPVTLKSYFDANLHLQYAHNERLSGFLKFNNIANQAYQKWLNYPVQGFQFVLGACYKFDF
jgi:hypothetical protein